MGLPPGVLSFTLIAIRTKETRVVSLLLHQVTQRGRLCYRWKTIMWSPRAFASTNGRFLFSKSSEAFHNGTAGQGVNMSPNVVGQLPLTLNKLLTHRGLVSFSFFFLVFKKSDGSRRLRQCP